MLCSTHYFGRVWARALSHAIAFFLVSAHGLALQVTLSVARAANEAVVQIGGSVLVVVDSSGSVVARLERDMDLAALQVAPMGNPVAAMSREGELVVWDWRLGAANSSYPFQKKLPATGHNTRELDEICFAPDAQSLLVGVHGNSARVVSTAGVVAGRVSGIRPLPFGPSVVWNCSGELIAYANELGVAVLNSRTLAPAETASDGPLSLGWTSPVTFLEFHPALPQLATGHRDGRIRITDVATGAEIRIFEHVDPLLISDSDLAADPIEEKPWIGWLSYSRDGTRLAYTSASAVFLGCFDLSRGERIAFSPYADGRMGTPARIEWCAQGERVYYGIIGGNRQLRWAECGGEVRYGSVPVRGRTVPSFGKGSIGFFLQAGALCAINGITGELLWTRTGADLLGEREMPSDAAGGSQEDGGKRSAQLIEVVGERHAPTH